MEKRTFSVILFLLCIFLFVPKAQAIDAGFENKLLKARPLSELVGERPLPVSESYFLCMDERNEELLCSNLVQQKGNERIMIPLSYFLKKCKENEHSEQMCLTVQNHILSRNLLLSNIFKSLAFGLEFFPDNIFGRATVWSIYYSSQDIIIGILTALAQPSPWQSPSYKEALECSKKSNEDINVCMSNIFNEKRKVLQTTIRDLAMRCLSENFQQCTKNALDYDKYTQELEQALFVLDSLAHKEPQDRKLYIRLILQDLQIQLMRTLMQEKGE